MSDTEVRRAALRSPGGDGAGDGDAGSGPLAAASRYVNQRAAAFDDSIATCPNCAAPSVRIEIRDAFSLGELMQRFGYSMAPVKYALAELEAFVERAAARSREQVHPFDMTGFEGRDDLIYYTSIPWVSFTQLNHTITHDREDSVPRLSWGKYREEGGCVVLPYSVQVHHAFVDGIHIARFKDALEAMLNAL